MCARSWVRYVTLLAVLTSKVKTRNRVRQSKLRGSVGNWAAKGLNVALLGCRPHAGKFTVAPAICIVGANDGKFGDPIFPLIESHLAKETDVLLFEPQPSLIPVLSGNYAFHPAHHIINAAVGPDSELVLHAVRQEAWSSLSPGYARNWPVYRAPTGITSSERQRVVDLGQDVRPGGHQPG